MAVKLSREAEAEVIAIGNRVIAQYPRAWSHCHREGDPERYDFIILFGRAANKSPIIRKTHVAGINGKRGNERDLSMDILDFLANGDTNLRDIIAVDVLENAGDPARQRIYYTDITNPAGAGAVWLDPFAWPTKFSYPDDGGPIDPPDDGDDDDPPVDPPATTPEWAKQLIAQVASLHSKVDDARTQAARAVALSEATEANVRNLMERVEVVIHQNETIAQLLRNPPRYVGRIPLAGTITLNPQQQS